MHCYQLCITLATLPYFIPLVAYFRGKNNPTTTLSFNSFSILLNINSFLGFLFYLPNRSKQKCRFLLMQFLFTLAKLFPVTNTGNTSPMSPEALLSREQDKNPKQGENKAKPTCTEKLRQLWYAKPSFPPTLWSITVQ